MTIALVDDSDSDIELLHDYLSRYCHDHHVYMTIEKFTDEHIFLNSMQHKTYDLVFLDIYMEHMDGIQLACEISREDPSARLSSSLQVKNMLLPHIGSMPLTTLSNLINMLI